MPTMDNRVMRGQVLQNQGKGNNSAEKSSQTSTTAGIKDSC